MKNGKLLDKNVTGSMVWANCNLANKPVVLRFHNTKYLMNSAASFLEKQILSIPSSPLL